MSADVIASEPSGVLAIERAEVWALAESSRLQAHFKQLATIDGLTGLRNRRWLESAFERQLARCDRDGEPASILMIDIDHFKKLNDEHGHLVGDAVLCRTARLLADGLRPSARGRSVRAGRVRRGAPPARVDFGWRRHGAPAAALRPALVGRRRTVPRERRRPRSCELLIQRPNR